MTTRWQASAGRLHYQSGIIFWIFASKSSDKYY